MKLKYYLRGLGIGIIVTTFILMIAFSRQKTEMTDAEIIQRAEELGMVMQEDNDSLFSHNSEKTEQTETVNTETESEMESESEKETEVETESETELESETESESEGTTESEGALTGEVYHLVISSGMVPRLICNELEENGVIESASDLREYLVEVGYATSIKVGEYDIPYGATNEEIYQILKTGTN